MICDLKPSMAVELNFSSKVKPRVSQVGIELEGGWPDPDGRLPIEHDGSVHLDEQWTGEDELRYQTTPRGEERIRLRQRRREMISIKTGEMHSGPIHPDAIEEWILQHHPRFVNKTCGLHVHMSFKDVSHYNRLVTPAYPATILKYLWEWGKKVGVPPEHPLWDRLAGKSDYCRARFCDVEQLHRIRKDFNHTAKDSRYTVIAYHWTRLGTIECRVLPMFQDPSMSALAVMEVIKITNQFLASQKERPGVTVKLQPNGQVTIKMRGDQPHVRHRGV